MCEVFTFLNKTYANHLCRHPEKTTRGHSQKLIISLMLGTYTGIHFFSHIVVDSWNNLAEEAISVPSLPPFKMILSCLPLSEKGETNQVSKYPSS